MLKRTNIVENRGFRRVIGQCVFRLNSIWCTRNNFCFLISGNFLNINWRADIGCFWNLLANGNAYRNYFYFLFQRWFFLRKKASKPKSFSRDDNAVARFSAQKLHRSYCNPPQLFPQIHSLPPWTAATKIGTQGRKSGKKGAGEENRASGNFSRAKYHADWLEVMKFWWLIKCKKIYRLRPSALPFLLFFSGWSQSPASRASFLLHFSFVSRSFRGAAGFAKWTEERLKGAKGDVGVNFKTPGNRLGSLEESTTNCTTASLFLSLRLGPLSNSRESHFLRLNVSFRGKIPLYSQKHCYSIDENVDFVDFSYPDRNQLNV